jgi:putative transcriptional regulator
MAASLKGQLLIASPSIHDPNFRRTVVYMTEHGEEGAMGLVLNRAAETTVGEAVPDLAWLADEDAVVHVGGPVAPQSVVVLAEFEEDVFTPEPEELWSTVLRRKGQQYALLSTMPMDPSLN